MKHNDLLIQAEENLTNEERLALWRQRMQDYLDKRIPPGSGQPDWWEYVDQDENYINQHEPGGKHGL